MPIAFYIVLFFALMALSRLAYTSIKRITYLFNSNHDALTPMDPIREDLQKLRELNDRLDLIEMKLRHQNADILKYQADSLNKSREQFEMVASLLLKSSLSSNKGYSDFIKHHYVAEAKDFGKYNLREIPAQFPHIKYSGSLKVGSNQTYSNQITNN